MTSTLTPPPPASDRHPEFLARARHLDELWSRHGAARFNEALLPTIIQARQRARWYAVQHIDPSRALPEGPVITRALLQRYPGAFLGPEQAMRTAYRGSTSGSTGVPVQTFMCAWAMASYWLHLRWVADLYNARLPAAPLILNLSIGTRAVESMEAPPFWARGLVRADAESGERAWRLIAAHRPDVLTTTPGALAALCEPDAMERASALHGVRLALTTAQHLDSMLRQRARELLGCPVVDSYGAAELGPIAARCPVHEDRWHVTPVGMLVEDVGGQMTCTTLRNTAMPLSRYQVGDAIFGLRDDRCACGFSGQTFDRLVGRGATMLLDREERSVSALPLIRALCDERWALSSYQIVQRASGAVTVRARGSCEMSELQAALGSVSGLDVDVVSAAPIIVAGKASAVLRLTGRSNIQEP